MGFYTLEDTGINVKYLYHDTRTQFLMLHSWKDGIGKNICFQFLFYILLRYVFHLKMGWEDSRRKYTS